MNIDAPNTELLKKIDYMQNCLYWLKDYANGNINKKQALNSLQHLQDHCKEFIEIINPAKQTV